MEKQQPIDPAFVRHTLLAGSGLPQRWQGRQRFVIVDTDFGVGLNFLTVWQAWQADPQRCRRLHVVAAARQPASRDELAGQQAAWPELAEQAGELQANWPPATSGMHRLHLAAGQVILTLIFGEAADPWRAVDAATDAFFLGTDSPAALPERCRALARLAAPGATLTAPQASEPLAAALRAAEFPHGLALPPAGEAGQQACANMAAALTEPASLDELAADYAAIYLNNSLGASPYESVWLSDDHLACAAPMFELRELYAAAGLRAADWRSRFDDHFVLQLQYLQHLLHVPAEGRQAASFIDEHVGYWFPDFAQRVSLFCATSFYAALAGFTAALVPCLWRPVAM